MKAAIFLKSYAPDFPRLEYAVRGIERYAHNFAEVLIAIPEGETFSAPHCRVVQIRGETPENGYLFQQLCKMHVYQLTDADLVMHQDSDTVLTKPVTPETFMRDSKPLWLMTPYAHLEAGIAELSRANAGFHCGVMTWKAITEKFLGQPVEYEFMRRFPMLIPRSLHKAAAAFCQAKHGMRLTDYILSQPAKEFSEFNALGALAYYRAHDEFSWLDTTKEPLPELVAIQKWSHAPFTDADKAEFEEILKGGDAGCAVNVTTDTSAKCTGFQSDYSKTSSAAPTSQPERAAENPNIKQTKEGIWVLVNDSHISRWVEDHGTLFHDRQTLPKVLPEIPVGGTVIDVGANIGDTTAPFRDRVGRQGTVLAFEPNPDAFECLRLNMAGWHNVYIYQAALGDSDSILGLAPHDNAGARHLYVADSGQDVVQVFALDSLKFDRCDFIKIDVEGFELRVLRGAEQTINRFHPKMLIELNEGALQRQGTNQLEVCAWLQAHGYKWWPMQANLAPDSPQYDILCTYTGVHIGFDPAVGESETVYPEPIQTPDPEPADEIKFLAERLKKFCGSSSQTRAVRLELHNAGIIELPYRFKRRKKWRKRKAKA